MCFAFFLHEACRNRVILLQNRWIELLAPENGVRGSPTLFLLFLERDHFLEVRSSSCLLSNGEDIVWFGQILFVATLSLLNIFLLPRRLDNHQDDIDKVDYHISNRI